MYCPVDCASTPCWQPHLHPHFKVQAFRGNGKNPNLERRCCKIGRACRSGHPIVEHMAKNWGTTKRRRRTSQVASKFRADTLLQANQDYGSKPSKASEVEMRMLCSAGTAKSLSFVSSNGAWLLLGWIDNHLKRAQFLVGSRRVAERCSCAAWMHFTRVNGSLFYCCTGVLHASPNSRLVRRLVNQELLHWSNRRLWSAFSSAVLCTTFLCRSAKIRRALPSRDACASRFLFKSTLKLQ